MIGLAPAMGLQDLLSYSVILQGFLIDLIIGLDDMAPVGRVWLSKFWKDSVNLEKTKRSEKRSPWAPKNESLESKKKEISCPNTIGSCFLQRNAPILVKYSLDSPVYNLQPHIGGRHPVLYFTIQVTEKYSAAMY